MRNPLIQFKQVSFTYKNEPRSALNDINVTIYRGEKILVLGANGSGKSSFVRALRGQLGTEQYSGVLAGEIIYHNEDVATVDGAPLTDAIGDQIEKAGEDASLNREKTLTYILARAQQMDQSSSTKLTNTPVNALSFGQRDLYRFTEQIKKAEPLYLFDEPLANLAPRTADVFVDMIDDLHAMTDATIVIVEQRLEQMLSRPIDRVLVFSDGRIVSDSTVAQLLRDNILTSLSIREPLYITAMRYAGYPLDQVANITNVKHIFGPNLRETMENWLQIVPSFIYKQNDKELIRLENVSYTYPLGETPALSEINLTINRGEMITVVGENGAGKTTLSRLLDVEMMPQTGGIYWKGELVTADSAQDLADEIVYIPHQPEHMLSDVSVGEQIDRVLLRRDYSDENFKFFREESLRSMGLLYAVDMEVKRLSFSQKKRLALACALALNPSLLIIDEPTEAQDFKHYKELMHYINKINTEKGLAVLINTHDIELMLEYSRRTLVVSDGQIIADTTPVHVATDTSLIQMGALRETSIYTFAKQIGMIDPYTFIHKFMDYNREIQQCG